MTDLETQDEEEVEFDQEPIGDMDAAERALEKVAYWERRRAEVKELHAQKMQRIDDWAQEEEAKIDNRLAWPLSQLEAFHRAVFARDEKRKTINLPSGKLVTRPGSEKVVVDDEAAFLRSADFSLKIVTEKPDKAAIKTHIKETGEKLPAVRIEAGERKLEVKPA